MPLIIVILIIIVIFVNAHDSNKNSSKLSTVRANYIRKTNARMERSLVDYYMKYGYSFDEAFRESYNDMVKAGYEPCIPKTAYSHNTNTVQSSYCQGNISDYDSSWVNTRRQAAKKEWEAKHPGNSSHFAPPEEIDYLTYLNFPTNESEYLHDVRVQATKSNAIPVGNFLFYPGLGTCEVLAHNFIGDGYFGGTYTLRVLKTGEVISHINIGDKKISEQGKRL